MPVRLPKPSRLAQSWIGSLAARSFGLDGRACRSRRRRRPAGRWSCRPRRSTASPAFSKLTPPTLNEPASLYDLARGDQALLERRRRGDQLEGRARRVAALDRAVEQRRAVVLAVERLDRFVRDRRRVDRSGRRSGVEPMPRIEPSLTSIATKAPGSPNWPIAASPAAWIFLSSVRTQVVAGLRLDGERLCPSARRTRRPGRGSRRCGRAARVVLRLDAGRADPVARVEAARTAGSSSCSGADLADVAEQVGAEVALRVVADVDLLDGDAGELVLALAQVERRARSRHFSLQRHRARRQELRLLLISFLISLAASSRRRRRDARRAARSRPWCRRAARRASPAARARCGCRPGRRRCGRGSRRAAPGP